MSNTNNSADKEFLFLSASFENYQIGLARNDRWFYTKEEHGHIADNLQQALKDCIPLLHFDILTVYLINGPGSTLGIRTLCAFVRTLCALKKIQNDQIYTCNGLAFAHTYLSQFDKSSGPICARVNLTQTLCFQKDLHIASEDEKQNAIWLPHPCLKDQKTFNFTLENTLPILQKHAPWIQNPQPDVFQI